MCNITLLESILMHATENKRREKIEIEDTEEHILVPVPT